METCRAGFAEDGLPSGRTVGVPGLEPPAPWGAHSAQLDAARNGTVMHPASAAGTDLTCGAGYEAVGRLWPAVG